MKHFVGIDNSHLDHKVHIIDENGKTKTTFTIANTIKGFKELEKKLSVYHNNLIGFEISHGPLVDYLHHHKQKIYSLNPLKIKRYKEALIVSGNKTDMIDSLTIAEYLRINSAYCREMVFNSPEIERLKSLSAVHSKLTNEHSRYINKLHAVFKAYFPLQETLFSSVGGTVHLKMLIKYPTWAELQCASDEELTSTLKQYKYNNTVYIKRIIKKIRTHEQFISQDVEYSRSVEALCLCEMLLKLNEHISDIKCKMETILNGHPLGEVFLSLPGAGSILAAKLLSIFGDNTDRFHSANSVQGLYGTAPRNYQSGPYERVIMRKSCNHYGRDILYKFAFSSMLFSKWARAYYDRQRAIGKHHTAAVRALSNKWVRVIFKLWKDKIIYDESIKNEAAA